MNWPEIGNHQPRDYAIFFKQQSKRKFDLWPKMEPPASVSQFAPFPLNW